MPEYWENLIVGLWAVWASHNLGKQFWTCAVEY